MYDAKKGKKEENKKCNDKKGKGLWIAKSLCLLMNLLSTDFALVFLSWQSSSDVNQIQKPGARHMSKAKGLLDNNRWQDAWGNRPQGYRQVPNRYLILV